MKFLVDSHTHTTASGHAYSSLQEMAKGALENGIKMIAITDHGPSMLGAPCVYYFGNLRCIPEEIYGVRILKGVEANIINYMGEVDLPNKYLKKLDFVLASFHDICIKPSNLEDHTNALINALKNPFIDAIAHPGNPIFEIDIEKVVKVAKEENKFLEINNNSFKVRKGSENNCKTIINMCKKHQVTVVCGSDAHISFDVGKFDSIYEMLEELQFPEQLVLNVKADRFEKFIIKKKERFSI